MNLSDILHTQVPESTEVYRNRIYLHLIEKAETQHNLELLYLKIYLQLNKVHFQDSLLSISQEVCRPQIFGRDLSNSLTLERLEELSDTLQIYIFI